MAEFYQANSSIECLKANIICRKKTKGVLVNNERLGKTGKEFKCERDASAEINKILNSKADKKVSNSNINLGDILKSKEISVFIECFTDPKTSVSNNSHTHKAIFFNTKYYTFGIIIHSFPNIPQIMPSNVKEIS